MKRSSAMFYITNEVDDDGTGQKILALQTHIEVYVMYI